MHQLKFVIAAAMVAATLAPVASFAGSFEGRRAWLEYNCYGCHGNNGGGGMGPNIRHAEAGDVAEAMNGEPREGGMRSFSGIATATDAANIAAYLATIGTANEPKWLDWWNPIP